jgi:hypothetical protein
MALFNSTDVSVFERQNEVPPLKGNQQDLHSHRNTHLQHMNALYNTNATMWLDILQAS